MLGIDPGTRATGYGCIERDSGRVRLLECGVIRPDPDDPLPQRLVTIHDGLRGLIERIAPSCVAVEGLFTGRNARTAMVLGHARGVIVLAAASRGLEIGEYPPRVVKKTVVGTGNATKEQVAYMVQQQLRLTEMPKPADAADGCAIALCHLISISGPSGAIRPGGG